MRILLGFKERIGNQISCQYSGSFLAVVWDRKRVMKTDQNEPETIIQRLNSLDCLEKEDNRQISRKTHACLKACCLSNLHQDFYLTGT